MVFGLCLLGSHAGEAEKTRKATLAGHLSPKRHTTGRSHSTQLLSRLLVCAVFIFGAVIEITVPKNLDPKNMMTVPEVQDLQIKLGKAEGLRRGMVARQAGLVATILRTTPNLLGEQSKQREQNLAEIAHVEHTINKMNHQLDMHKRSAFYAQGSVFFWPETVLGLFVGLGLFMHITPNLLAVVLVVEAANIDWIIGLGPLNFLEQAASEKDEAIMEMLCDICLAGSLMILGKLGGGKYSIDSILKKQE
jgi:hypothetical protein